MEQKVTVITGVSSGLGYALAKKFKKEGHIVIGLCRTKPDLDIDLWIKTDITKERDRQSALKKVIKDYGKCDILINNAGIGEYSTWAESTENELKKLFELNFFSVVTLTTTFLDLLITNKGTIINVSSIAGKIYVPCMGNYCASKYALNAFSDSLRVELRKKVNVLNIITGRINTGFSSRAIGKRTPPSSPSMGSATPTGFANAVYKAYKNNKRSIYYPKCYRFVPLFVKIFTNFFEKKNYKIWHLD